jgi:hypothetical protein
LQGVDRRAAANDATGKMGDAADATGGADSEACTEGPLNAPEPCTGAGSQVGGMALITGGPSDTEKKGYSQLLPGGG